ncbi:2-amino-4-hydroxy-6-hydroxymethyldihydropteridine diphosphokinase [Clostridium tarantellae]|uniref:Bifunctional folate synthesis protein n=1 Tax=Clostridium tarantellae TaxID=39493 RepID=A0A6I1MV87_9CLOT|nr:2-amino-4-hydroxy-6-hydroxymethyldihydropteridine diphosphokinase [Clostridium tarantellae]MPQ44119.1 2-amino-4-hydroxy-6-hydroxymethyldihydropteridine diphosphokinase [Clostridium tarantellae]
MDKIIIKDLEVFANHGVFQEEKKLGQKFLISLELGFSLREAALTGDLNKTVHYGEICHRVEEEFKKECYDLIETACEKICSFLLIEYKLIKSVKIILKKPWAPIVRSLDTVFIEMERKWNKAYIAYGSNLGDKEQNIKEALLRIGELSHTKVIKTSKLIETEPWGYTEQDNFLNGVCEIKTLLTPKELMNFMLHIEKELKRERSIKWGPRTIDLDILLYNDLITDDDDSIIIPHPRMHMREFVLNPLNEIAPYLIHPLYKKRIFELVEMIKNN